MVRGNHGLAGGAREFPTRPVSQFVEEEKERRKPRWNELEGKLSAGGGEGEGLYRTWERNCYPLRFSLRSVRGVKGIRSLSRRANSRLAELWAVAEMVVELVRENSPPLLQSEFRCFFPSPPFSTNAESNSISSDVWTFPRHLYEISLFRVCIGQRGEDIFPSFSYPLNNEWTDKWMKSRMF